MRPRVLLADDHPEMMRAVEHLVASVCEVVGKIVDGADAFEAVARLRPDVLVVDVHMPSLDGIEICRQVRQAFPETQVIVITAEMDPALQDSAARAGASGFIQKFSVAEDLPEALVSIGNRLR
jgi:DNA-binding NarL/FixJ family response regulator